MDDQLDIPRMSDEGPLDTLGVADVDLERSKLIGIAPHQRLSHGRCRGIGPEEAGTHIVLEADHLEAGLNEVSNRLRADQTSRSGDDRYGHACAHSMAVAIRLTRIGTRGYPPNVSAIWRSLYLLISAPLDEGSCDGAQQCHSRDSAEVDELGAGVPDFVGNAE